MFNDKIYSVYITTNKKEGTLYVGVTNNLPRRIFEHKSKLIKSFTKKYNLDILVYHEEFESIESAINYEKKLKTWKRQWKIDLIKKDNPEWQDLYEIIF